MVNLTPKELLIAIRRDIFCVNLWKSLQPHREIVVIVKRRVAIAEHRQPVDL